MQLTRRRFLALLPPSLGAFVLLACSDDSDSTSPTATQPASGSGTTSSPSDAPSPTAATGAAATSQQLAPTPACGDDDDPTPAQTEGPYFTPNSPARVSLVESGMAGTKLVIEGYVLSTSCQPVARALVDFWQCDNAGNYDNAGYRLRGHQFTDAQGIYRLKTIVPAPYPGRTPHIHVKVQAPSGRVLTTQLYFPDQPGNRSDGLFRPELLLRVAPTGEGLAGRFDFVLDQS